MRNASNNGHSRHADPVDTLARDVAALKRDIGQLLGDGAGNVKSRVREAVNRLGDEAQVVADKAVDQYELAHDSLAKTASAKPITTIMVAMAAGAVTAKLLGWAMRR